MEKEGVKTDSEDTIRGNIQELNIQITYRAP
jgi:hypothetical protein